VQYIIVDVLHESIDLTSRMGIYEKMDIILNNDPMFGSALDNNYTVSVLISGAADVQNGILDIFVSYGWVGVAVFILISSYVVYRSRYCKSVALLAALYVYVGLASVEITFRTEFYDVMFLIVLCSWRDEPVEETPPRVRSFRQWQMDAEDEPQLDDYSPGPHLENNN